MKTTKEINDVERGRGDLHTYPRYYTPPGLPTRLCVEEKSKKKTVTVPTAGSSRALRVPLLPHSLLSVLLLPLHIQLQPPPTSTEELPPPTLLTLRLLHPDTLLPLLLLQLLTSSMGTATTREGGRGERGGEADQDGPGREDSDLKPGRSSKRPE